MHACGREQRALGATFEQLLRQHESLTGTSLTHIRHYYNFEVNVLGTILDRFQLSEPTGAYTS